MKKFLFLLIIFTLIFIGCSDDDSSSPDTTVTLKVGALMPLSGDYAQQGEANLKALQLAVTDINADFEDQNDDTRVELVYLDTKTDGTTAKANALALINQDIKMIIGPMTSGELESVMEVTDSAACCIISPSSTMMELADDDNIFRIVPNDEALLTAVIDVMWEEGVRHLGIIYRGDAWGTSVSARAKAMFEAKGGTFLEYGEYNSLRQSEIRAALEAINTEIETNLSEAEYGTAAVLTICFDEGTMILEYAGEYAALPGVKWYGCDGFVKNDYIFEVDAALQFAADVEFKSAIFGIEATTDYSNLKTRIEAEAGHEIDTYPILSYDAIRVAVNVLNTTTADAQLRENLINQLNGYNGVAGDITLNDCGDRQDGRYDFWTIQNGTNPQWIHALTYDGGVITP